jgi:hypothetical protein
MQAQAAIKQSLLKQLIALLVFALIGGMFAIPIFTTNGEIAGRSKLILFFFVFWRLALQTHRRTFRFRDYFIYFAIYIGFCIWLDSYADA